MTKPFLRHTMMLTLLHPCCSLHLLFPPSSSPKRQIERVRGTLYAASHDSQSRAQSAHADGGWLTGRSLRHLQSNAMAFTDCRRA